MSRIKLVIPDTAIATCTIPIRIGDINYGNHVGNDAFVSIIHESRVRWLTEHGYSELNAGGTGLIMADLAVEFRNESFYGDIVDIKLAAGNLSRVSFDLFYELTVQRNGERILLANAKTGMVCFDYGVKKISAIPEKLRTLLVL